MTDSVPQPAGPPPSAQEMRTAFDAPAPLTVGVEEELMLLEPDTLDLAARAPAVLERMDGDRRFKLEFPAAQFEIALPPLRSAAEVAQALSAARAELARRAGDLVRFAATGVHPFAPAEGRLNAQHRYRPVAEEYGTVARRQLPAALQVHVAVGGADRTLAVYNALRSYLPELAALAANAPFHEGRDTGLASWRPKVADILPRQGVPPALESWEAFARELAWGRRAGTLHHHRVWWWEMRPSVAYGTLEVRVPDAQTTVAEAAAVTAVVHALVAWLARRADAGDLPQPDATWRIEENRWSACRHGVEGTLADLRTGEPRPARERLAALFDEIGPCAHELGGGQALAHAREMLRANGAMRQRAVARERGVRGLAAWLAESFSPGSVPAQKVDAGVIFP